MFQSAPAIAGGRCGTSDMTASCTPCFNPRPPLLAGDAMRTLRSRGVTEVSIRARHCWRAMPAARFFPPLRCQGFNPRPPLLAGDAGAGGSDRAGRQVSIRARHCWRAMRRKSSACLRRTRFQSAPAIAGGRCVTTARLCAWCRSFNPRPPLLAGDASFTAGPAHRCPCFNPRPPLLAGDAPATPCAPPAPPWFQSAPAIAGGRCASWGALTFPEVSFNPRPPLLAGDASFAYLLIVDAAVSIRARHCWRAMRRRRPAR